ncbi:MAG: peptidoglycan-binding domain-containing protein [Terriglobales bacterium]
MRPLLLVLLFGFAAALPQQVKKLPAKAASTHHAAARRRRVPAGIAPSRARQIQAALVTAGYLERVSGHWDTTTRAALEKYQRDHHWQTRFVPDARALIALGLGPHPVSAVADAAAGRGPGL